MEVKLVALGDNYILTNDPVGLDDLFSPIRKLHFDVISDILAFLKQTNKQTK